MPLSQLRQLPVIVPLRNTARALSVKERPQADAIQRTKLGQEGDLPTAAYQHSRVESMSGTIFKDTAREVHLAQHGAYTEFAKAQLTS